MMQDNYDGPHAGADRPPGPVPEPSRQRLRRHRGRDGDQHPAAHLREVADAALWALEHPDATRDELLAAAIQRVKGPDFPTGAQILGVKGIQDSYRTGRGSITMRAVVKRRELQGPTALVVTELPYRSTRQTSR